MPGHLRSDRKHRRAGSPSLPPFFCLLMLLAQLVLPGGFALAAGTESPLDLPRDEFRPVPTDYPVTNAVITEDGKFVVVAHENDNLLSVWELPKLRLVKEIACPCPRFLLSLQGRLYVASYETGKVSVYSQDDWQLLDQLQSGCQKLLYLSAPRGKFFTGTIIANGLNQAVNGQESVEVWAINTVDDTCRLLGKQYQRTFATVSYNGEGVLNFIENGSPFSIEYRDFIKGSVECPQPETEKFQTDKTNQLVLHQPTAAPFWFSCSGAAMSNFFYKGFPPRGAGNLPAGTAIPDLNGKYAYLFTQGTLCTVRLDSPPLIENRRQCTAMLSLRKPAAIDRDRICFPGAISQDGNAYILIVVAPQLYLGVFSNVFADPTAVQHYGLADNAPAAPPPGPQAGTGEPAVRPSEPAPLQDSVRKATVGEPLTILVMSGNTKAAFTLVNGPDNASVSDSGTFSWTPAANQTGPHHIKIRVKSEAGTSFVRFVVDVAPGGPGAGKVP